MADLRLYGKKYGNKENGFLILDYGGLAQSLNSFCGREHCRNFLDMEWENDSSGNYMIKRSGRNLALLNPNFFADIWIALNRRAGDYILEARLWNLNNGEGIPPQLLQIFDAVGFSYTNFFSGEKVINNINELNSLEKLFEYYGNAKKRKRSAVIA